MNRKKISGLYGIFGNPMSGYIKAPADEYQLRNFLLTRNFAGITLFVILIMDILIIEDDKLTLNLLQHVIKQAGHKAFTAENAEQAISLVSAKKFDLIISDIMMPGISGLSLISILRTVHLVNTPIIIMSALNNKPLLDAAFAAGANDFIAKPFTIEELETKLKRHVVQGA